jgi:hypothetical protein
LSTLAVAQPPQPRAMRRHALDWITHCPERLERPPINPKRQFLAARLPPPRMRPVINLRRTQHFSAARCESAPDPHLHRTAALGWRRRPVTQVTMVRPFRHRGTSATAVLLHLASRVHDQGAAAPSLCCDRCKLDHRASIMPPPGGGYRGLEPPCRSHHGRGPGGMCFCVCAVVGVGESRGACAGGAVPCRHRQ